MIRINFIIIVTLLSFNNDDFDIKKLKIKESSKEIQIKFRYHEPSDIDFIYIKYGRVGEDKCNVESLTIKTTRDSDMWKIQQYNKKMKVIIFSPNMIDVKPNYYRIQISDKKGNYSNYLIYDEQRQYEKHCLD